jgi:OCT family organic cation transporter-like MFS transporter 4/5
MVFIGSLSGFFVFPYLADNWGRKISIRLSWAVGTIGVLIVAVSDSPNMVGLGYFFAGFGTNPAITLCFSFINEQCLGKSRQRFGVAVQIFWALGESTIGLIFLSSTNWRIIFVILLFLCILVNITLLYL